MAKSLSYTVWLFAMKSWKLIGLKDIYMLCSYTWSIFTFPCVSLVCLLLEKWQSNQQLNTPPCKLQTYEICFLLFVTDFSHFFIRLHLLLVVHSLWSFILALIFCCCCFSWRFFFFVREMLVCVACECVEVIENEIDIDR